MTAAAEVQPLKAPFPWFGGKSSVAAIVWERFGDVPNYVEPFFGSGAVLLGRPHEPKIETVNDRDGFVSNFWRATQADPEGVAKWADWPVNENDLHARHAWLVTHAAELTARLEGGPDYFDAKIAGWWVWGLCAWIGSGWCEGKGPWRTVDGRLCRTGESGGIKRQRPHLGGAGQGINRKRPHLSNAGQGINKQDQSLSELFAALSARLRRVRVCSGDWSRICGYSPTTCNGLTGAFLDPPYLQTERDANIYRQEDNVSAAVREWAIEHGDDPLMRIALCGYDGEHVMPESWECVAWKAHGGYAHTGNGAGKANAGRERIWFSPHCLKIETN